MKIVETVYWLNLNTHRLPLFLLDLSYTQSTKLGLYKAFQLGLYQTDISRWLEQQMSYFFFALAKTFVKVAGDFAVCIFCLRVKFYLSADDTARP